MRRHPFVTRTKLMSHGGSIRTGDYVTIRGLVKRFDLNSKVGKVLHIPNADSDRVGVNVFGDNFSVKISNIDPDLTTLVTFADHPTRLDLSKAICYQYTSKHRGIYVPHRHEIVDNPTLQISSVPWDECTRVLFNLMSKYGAPVLSTDEGHLGGIRRDLCNVDTFSASEQHEILHAAKIEDSSALLLVYRRRRMSPSHGTRH